MNTKVSKRLSDQLRRIVSDSGKTLGEIARGTGIDKSALSRFVNGERGVSLQAWDRLGEYFGLELRPARKPAKAKRK